MMNKKIAKTEYCNMIAVWLPVVKNCVSITWYKHRTSTSCLHKLWWFEQREITFWWSKRTVSFNVMVLFRRKRKPVLHGFVNL